MSVSSRRIVILIVIVVLWIPSFTYGVAAYSRNLYRHWSNMEGDCQDTRTKVLIREARPGTVKFADDDNCVVAAGEWIDPYTGRTVSRPSELDIDHIVPLKHAHLSGGWSWPPQRRRDYANQLAYRLHLLAVSASANRQKGDRSPVLWRPENESFWCSYAQAWASVKFVNNLRSTARERRAVAEMLEKCS